MKPHRWEFEENWDPNGEVDAEFKYLRCPACKSLRLVHAATGEVHVMGPAWYDPDCDATIVQSVLGT